MKRIIIFLLTLHFCEAQIIHIPADRPTIQAGINAAGSGDTVLVADGLYQENILYYGKKITVASYFLIDGDTSHITNTIIDGSQPIDPEHASVISFTMFEDTNSVICGFTITGGKGTYYSVDNSWSGGGIIVIDAGATIKNNHIEWNSISGEYLVSGAGICVWPSILNPKTKIIGNKIRYNSLVSNKDYISGGGLDIYSNADIMDNEIALNICQSTKVLPSGEPPVGGGLSIWGAFGQIVNIKLTHNLIHHNHIYSTHDISFGANGGGLYINGDCTGIISGNNIEYNEVDALNYCLGAGVSMVYTDTSLCFMSNKVAHNFSSSENCLGGGIYFFQAGLKLINNLFHDNRAAYGGALLISGNIGIQPVEIINNTIVENLAAEEGGGVLLENAEAEIINTILWGNEANDGDQIFVQGSDIGVWYSDIEGEWEGEGNIDDYPDFWDEDTLFHIQGSSQCINAGVDSLDINGIWYHSPVTDFDSEERPFPSIYCDPVPDIGADEAEFDCVKITTLNQSSFSVQSYPNPFTDYTAIEFYLPEARQVSLKVYDLTGREIGSLVNGVLVSGEHTFTLQADDLQSGIYLYRLTAGEEVVSGKVVVK